MKVDSLVRQLFHDLLRLLLTTMHFVQCCELVQVNLTIIIIIQRNTHAFDCRFHCAFDKSNVCGSHSNANA